MRVGKIPDNPVWVVNILGDFGYDTKIPVAVFLTIDKAAEFAKQLGIRNNIETLDISSVIIKDYRICHYSGGVYGT